MLVYKDGVVAHYQEVFKNTSFTAFGPSDEFLSENNAYKVNVFLPHDRQTQKLVGCEPYIQDGWAYTVKVEAKTQKEMDADKESHAANVRKTRDDMLASCDWTQLDDTPITNAKKLEWAAYRQSLRDVPSQAGFPWNVNWPVSP